MKTVPGIATLFMIVTLTVSACSPSAPAVTRPPAKPPTETSAPAETAIPEPSATPTAALLGLEIVEWSEFPYANLADPSNTDTHVEALIRNPNNFPVRVNTTDGELRFVNAAGEVVYANPSPFFYLWQGEWMLPGETTALSACVCFQTSGMEKRDWVSLQLTAPLEMAADIAYTPDVEVRLGEFFNLADAHLGGSGLGTEITLTNTSDLVLESIPMRVLARDAGGRHVGVVTFGNAVASFTETISIQPGDSATGIVVSEIDYIAIDVPLTYEAAAIGIPARAAGEVDLPSGTPLDEWQGIPIMPGALSGGTADGGYQFTTLAEFDEITGFYETELARLGFTVGLTVDENAGYAILTFDREGTAGMVAIASLGGLNAVQITFTP